MNTIPLDNWDMAVGALLILCNALLSLILNLGLEKQFLIAAIRMVVQLGLMGLLLKALFALVSPLWTGLAALVMVLFAGREIMARQERRLQGFWAYGLGTATMCLATFLVTAFALTTQIRPDPWYDPRYALPLLGMILGNTMTGISLGVHTLSTGLVKERNAVEAQLMLGATRWRATLPVTRGALRSALMPIVNSMAATGLVFLPGMMTGQILAGAEPIQAVKYQMLVMFLIAGGTTLGAVGAVLGLVYRLTDARHRLRLDRFANFE